MVGTPVTIIKLAFLLGRTLLGMVAGPPWSRDDHGGKGAPASSPRPSLPGSGCGACHQRALQVTLSRYIGHQRRVGGAELCCPTCWGPLPLSFSLSPSPSLQFMSSSKKWGWTCLLCGGGSTSHPLPLASSSWTEPLTVQSQAT